MNFQDNLHARVLSAILAILVIVVVVQSVFLVRMNTRLAQMAGSERKMKAPTLALPNMQPPTASKRHSKAPTTKILPDDDWFSSPFDPDKWNPFEEMKRMHEQMDRMFQRAFGRFQKTPRFRPFARDYSFSPDVDIDEDKDKYVIHVDLPGVDKSDIKVELKDQVLRISGNRTETVEETDPSGHSVRRERRMGRFERSIRLSKPVDAAKMRVKNEKGTLTIIVPKVVGKK